LIPLLFLVLQFDPIGQTNLKCPADTLLEVNARIKTGAMVKKFSPEFLFLIGPIGIVSDPVF